MGKNEEKQPSIGMFHYPMRVFLALLVVALLTGCGSPTTRSTPPEHIADQTVTQEVIVLPEIGIQMVHIPGGEFMMGKNYTTPYPPQVPIDNPPHRVQVGDFYIGKYEVTWGQWERVMGKEPLKTHRRKRACEQARGGCPCEDTCPAIFITWSEIQDFLRKASDATGKALRLPTEAEWEYAAGGGAVHQEWAGTSVSEEVKKYAVTSSDANIFNLFRLNTQPVGQRRPNIYGLLDMSGNLQEWCEDWYDSRFYDTSPVKNPVNRKEGKKRVVRGGDWYNAPFAARVSYRKSSELRGGDSRTGFRVAMDTPIPSSGD